MRRILTAQREQEHLLPSCIEDWIGPEHPARFVESVVAQMDLVAQKLDTLKRDEGAEAHDPSVLLMVWLYGYYDGVRSTRALEKACRDNMAYIWLTGNTRPDHNTLWRYWNKHRGELGAMFKRTIKVALEMKLVDMVVLALDGTKIGAACGKQKWDKARLAKLLGKLDEELAGWEKQIAEAGKAKTPIQANRRRRS